MKKLSRIHGLIILNSLKMTTRLLTILTVLLCLLRPSLGDSSIYEVPFDKSNRGPLIIIKASVNGSAPLPFVFDTGSDLGLVINENFPGISTTETGKSLVVNQSTKFQQIEPTDLTIKASPDDLETSVKFCYKGNLKFLDDFYGKGKIAGVIGGDLPHFLKVVIDFDNNKLKLGLNSTIEELKFPIDKSHKITLERNVVSRTTPVVKIPSGIGALRYAIIDTGTNTSAFTDELIKYYKSKKSRTRHLGLSISSPSEDYAVMITDFILYKEPQDIIANKTHVKNINFIGLDYLTRFNILLDYKNQELYLSPRNTPIKTSGYRGFSITKSNNKFTVDHVDARFSGNEKILIGDEIIQDSDITIYQLMYSLDGYIGDEHEIKVKRNNVIMSIKYKSISMFD